MTDSPHSLPVQTGNPSPTIRPPESESERTIEVEQVNPISEKEEDTPPDGGYGWIYVVCCALINAHTWGINSSYGVFLSYYLNNNYFPDTSALAYAFIGGLSIATAMLIAPVATHTVHVLGTKTCLYLGVFFETCSLIGASFAKQKWQLLLSQGICFGWGMGFLFVGSVGIIPQWFSKRRSLANSIAAAGSGMGGLIYSLAAGRMIQTIGLSMAFRVLGICCFVVNLTASTLLKDRNKQIGSRHRAFDFATLKRPEFLLIQAWAWGSILGYVILIFSLSAYARAIGLSAQQAYIVGAIFNLGQMLGRPLIGLASDRWGRMNIAASLSFLCGVFCFAFWIPAEDSGSKMGLLTFFAVVGGALAGTFWTTVAPVEAEVIGLKDLPSALNLTWLSVSVPSTVAEAIGLELRRQRAKHWIYLHCQIFAACMYVGAAVFLWIARGWKIGQMEEASKRLQEQGRRQDSVLQVEKSVVAEGDQLGRVRTQSAEGSWDVRQLTRRMVTWTKV